MDSRVMVAIRVRPMNAREKRNSERAVATVLDENTLQLYNPFDEDDILRQNRPKEKLLAFDHVFDERATQEQVFDQTARLLIDDVLGGTNATVFAYGATGSGKTHTMQGKDGSLGIVPQMLSALFQRIAGTDPAITVSMSYIEIYNETVRDLLGGARESDYLELREDPHRGTVIVGMQQVEAESVDELLNHLRQGNRHRITESTAANSVSSRSHSVVQLVLSRKSANGKKQHMLSKLSLIDLAGSERAAATQNVGLRMLEGSMINRSLLALGNCINALSSRAAPAYVNYRDSKLTRLLKDSLGGGTASCRTVMIANVSPGEASLEETWNTLKYAARAKTIKVKIDIRGTTAPGNNTSGMVDDNEDAKSVGSKGSTSRLYRKSSDTTSPTKFAAPSVAKRILAAATGKTGTVTKAKPNVRNLKTPGPRNTMKPGASSKGAVLSSTRPAGLKRNDSETTTTSGERRPFTTTMPTSSFSSSSLNSSNGMSNGVNVSGTATRNAALKKKVQRLLQSHLEAKRRLLDLDEATAERTLSIAELQSAVEGITSQLELNGSAHFLSPSDHLSLESSLTGYRDSLINLSQSESHAHETRAKLVQQLSHIGNRVSAIEDEIHSSKLSLVDAEYGRLLLAHHAAVLDNMDLESTAVVTTGLIKHKDQALQLLLSQMQRARQLVEMQHPRIPSQAVTPEIMQLYRSVMLDRTPSWVLESVSSVAVGTEATDSFQQQQRERALSLSLPVIPGRATAAGRAVGRTSSAANRAQSRGMVGPDMALPILPILSVSGGGILAAKSTNGTDPRSDAAAIARARRVAVSPGTAPALSLEPPILS